MKKLILLLILVSTALFFLYTSEVFFNNNISNKENKKTLNSEKKFKVAILTPTTHPSLEEIEEGFKETLKKNPQLNLEFKTYNANGRKVLMRSQVEDIISSEFDLIFTIGAYCTQMAKEITLKKQKFIPIVFGAVDNPEELGLIKSKNFSGNNLTGVTENPSYEKQIELLLLLKPKTKNILLVYNPLEGAGLEKDKDCILSVLQKKNISLKTIEVFQTNEIQGKIANQLQNIDVLLVLKDCTVVPAINSLIKLCNRYSITLMTTDLDSGKKGAALSFGVKESDFGVQSAEKASMILLQNKKPTEISVTAVKGEKLLINEKTMHKQNLNLEPKLFHLIKNSKII